MSNTKHVVEGEASESDTEIELGRSTNTSMISQPEKNCKTFIVTGEASESDEDISVTNLQLNDADEPDLVIKDDSNQSLPPTPSKVSHPSLLHQKLWECNVSLRATVECLLKHTTELAVDKMGRADKTLLGVQENMRTANANLALARTKLVQIQAGFEKIGCGTALQNVKST